MRVSVGDTHCGAIDDERQTARACHQTPVFRSSARRDPINSEREMGVDNTHRDTTKCKLEMGVRDTRCDTNKRRWEVGVKDTHCDTNKSITVSVLIMLHLNFIYNVMHQVRIHRSIVISNKNKPKGRISQSWVGLLYFYMPISVPSCQISRVTAGVRQTFFEIIGRVG